MKPAKIVRFILPHVFLATLFYTVLLNAHAIGSLIREASETATVYNESTDGQGSLETVHRNFQPIQFPEGDAPYAIEQSANDFVAMHEGGDAVPVEGPNGKHRITSKIANAIHNFRQKEKDITAVLHIGPMKTGSTAIQKSLPEWREVLKEDNYELANWNWVQENGRQPINFVSCFKREGFGEDGKPLNATTAQDHRRLQLAYDVDCKEDTLRSALDIAKRGHNMLISAEYLPLPQRDVKALSEFLKPWKNVEIVVYYRRFYEWLISFANNNQKTRAVPNRIPLVWNLQYRMSLDEEEDQLLGWYTLGSANRFKEHFENVVVHNMHTIHDGDITEEFYCRALPGAANTCRKFKEKKAGGKKFRYINPSVTLVYEDLAYYAKEMGLWKESKKLTLKNVAFAARLHQENVLGLSPYDFKGKVCPDENLINWLRQKSWEAEYQLFPDYFMRQGKKEIADGIEAIRKTKLCHIRAKTVLKEPEWQQFFSQL